VSNPRVREHIKKQFQKMDVDGSGGVTMLEYMTFAGTYCTVLL
jgi:hypothetical protein